MNNFRIRRDHPRLKSWLGRRYFKEGRFTGKQAERGRSKSYGGCNPGRHNSCPGLKGENKPARCPSSLERLSIPFDVAPGCREFTGGFNSEQVHFFSNPVIDEL